MSEDKMVKVEITIPRENLDNLYAAQAELGITNIIVITKPEEIIDWKTLHLRKRFTSLMGFKLLNQLREICGKVKVENKPSASFAVRLVKDEVQVVFEVGRKFRCIKYSSLPFIQAWAVKQGNMSTGERLWLLIKYNYEALSILEDIDVNSYQEAIDWLGWDWEASDFYKNFWYK